MQNISDIEHSLNRKSFEFAEVKAKLKDKQRFMSREQLLILRRLRNKLWKEIKELKMKFELLQK